MILNSIIKKFKKIIKSKFFWKKQEHFPILIYDNANLELLKDYLPKRSYTVLNVRDKFNLRIIIKSFLNYLFKWNSHSYLDYAIKEINPRLIITTIDNSLYFWELKKKFNKIITVFIQNGYRDEHMDIFSLNTIKETRNKVDKMFVFNRGIGKVYSEYLDGQIIPIGSIYNNKTKFIKNNKRSIIYISQWVKYDPAAFKNNYQFYLDLLSADKLAFLAVGEFAKSNNIKLKVLGKKGLFNEKNVFEEEQFFRNINKNFEFLSQNSNSRKYSYKKINDSYLVVGQDSTLLYESLSQGKKTVFLLFRNKFLSTKKFSFGWPNKFGANGPFWTNLTKESYVNKLMDQVWKMSNQNWIKISKKYSKKLMVYNPNNTLIKFHLNKILNKII